MPPALMWGGIAIVLLIVVGISYSMFFKGPAQMDPKTISVQDLKDPDPPRTPRP